MKVKARVRANKRDILVTVKVKFQMDIKVERVQVKVKANIMGEKVAVRVKVNIMVEKVEVMVLAQ